MLSFENSITIVCLWVHLTLAGFGSRASPIPQVGTSSVLSLSLPIFWEAAYSRAFIPIPLSVLKAPSGRWLYKELRVIAWLRFLVMAQLPKVITSRRAKSSWVLAVCQVWGCKKRNSSYTGLHSIFLQSQDKLSNKCQIDWWDEFRWNLLIGQILPLSMKETQQGWVPCHIVSDTFFKYIS